MPHCELLAFFLLPKMSLLVMGAVRGLGRVMPEVSVSAVTSMAEGGAISECRIGLCSCFLIVF